MLLQSISNINVQTPAVGSVREAIPNNPDGFGPLFVMFHGYGNDEREMVRFIAALRPQADYVAYRGVYQRDWFLGGYSWFTIPPADGWTGQPAQPDQAVSPAQPARSADAPDSPDPAIAEYRSRSRLLGDQVVAQLSAPAYARRRKVLVGFSQGGYLSYRLLVDHPGFFDQAILLSPMFPADPQAELPSVAGRPSSPEVFLAYGTQDHEIPSNQQRRAAAFFAGLGSRLGLHRYPGMKHTVSRAELDDVNAFLNAAR